MPYIGIIIPIYKVEKYLNKCIDSVLNQSFEDIEVLLVDDGSPDNCPAICDKYAEKDNRVKVIHKKNGGLSDARNFGINNANGKYLIFLDSDDYWEGADCLKNLISKLNEKEVDVLVYGCKDYSCLSDKITVSRTGYNHELISSSSKSKVLEYFFSSGMFPGSAWITVTRRDFIIENNIYFIKGIKAEDIDWLLNVFLHANSYASIDDVFYIYLKYRNDSITGTADIKSIKDIIFTIEKWSSILESNEFDYIRAYANNFLAYHYLSTLILYNNLPISDKKEAANLIEKNKCVLKNLKTRKVKTASMIYKVFGLSLGSKILAFYHNCKKL